MISSFTGKYRWLSNFWPVKIEWMGITWPSLEHSYVATKCESFEDVHAIHEKTAGQVKRFGKKIKIRGDWEGMRVDTMRQLLQLKFQDPVLREKLLATDDEEIIEGNRWHDTHWGRCGCGKCPEGKNILGKLLMKLREQLMKSEIENAILNAKWEPVAKEKIEAWNTASRGWTINIALDQNHQDGVAARQSDGFIVRLTPELVKLAIEQIEII